ncbi:hypothetical protein D3C86_2082300 [compost metagenome]
MKSGAIEPTAPPMPPAASSLAAPVPAERSPCGKSKRAPIPRASNATRATTIHVVFLLMTA